MTREIFISTPCIGFYHEDAEVKVENGQDGEVWVQFGSGQVRGAVRIGFSYDTAQELRTRLNRVMEKMEKVTYGD